MSICFCEKATEKRFSLSWVFCEKEKFEMCWSCVSTALPISEIQLPIKGTFPLYIFVTDLSRCISTGSFGHRPTVNLNVPDRQTIKQTTQQTKKWQAHTDGKKCCQETSCFTCSCHFSLENWCFSINSSTFHLDGFLWMCVTVTQCCTVLQLASNLGFVATSALSAGISDASNFNQEQQLHWLGM